MANESFGNLQKRTESKVDEQKLIRRQLCTIRISVICGIWS